MRHVQQRYGRLAMVGVASLLLNYFAICLPAYAQSEDDPNEGLPPGTVGGGSRGSANVCSTPDPLLAFLPDDGVLKTADSQPSVWIYLPENSALETAEFVLYDQSDSVVIDSTFSVAGQSGLLKLDLMAIAHNSSSTDSFQAEALTLETDHHYRWFFSLVCSQDRAADISVDGWLQPTVLSSRLVHQTQSTHDPIAKANLYLQEGMWSAAIETLVDWQQSADSSESQVLTSLDTWTEMLDALSPIPGMLNTSMVARVTLVPQLQQ